MHTLDVSILLVVCIHCMHTTTTSTASMRVCTRSVSSTVHLYILVP
jgi:hypothetical protein